MAFAPHDPDFSVRSVFIVLDGFKIDIPGGGRAALTWSGHEFLDAARDEGRWAAAKRLTKEKAGSITMAALTQLLTQLMTQALGM